MLLNCGVGEDFESPLDCKEIQPVHPKGNQSWIFTGGWDSSSLATWCEELTHWKRPWCWERLKAGEGDDREWDGWMASLTQWPWAWVNSGSWWWTGKLQVCCSPWGCKESDWLSDWTEWTKQRSLLSWRKCSVALPPKQGLMPRPSSRICLLYFILDLLFTTSIPFAYKHTQIFSFLDAGLCNTFSSQLELLEQLDPTSHLFFLSISHFLPSPMQCSFCLYY